MHKVTDVKTKPDFILVITFADGTHDELCIADRLFGAMFEPLKDPNFFAQERVDEFGAVSAGPMMPIWRQMRCIARLSPTRSKPIQ